MKIVFATNNQHKLQEIRDILGSVTIFRIVKIIDPNAFVSQSAVIGVYGEGFDEMKVKIKEKDIKKLK